MTEGERLAGVSTLIPGIDVLDVVLVLLATGGEERLGGNAAGLLIAL